MTKRATFTKGLVAGAGATALAGALVFAAPLGATEDAKADGDTKHHEVVVDEQPRLEALFAKLQADKVEFLEAVAAHLAAAAKPAAAERDGDWGCDKDGDDVRAASAERHDGDGWGGWDGRRGERDHDGWDRHRKGGGWRR